MIAFYNPEGVGDILLITLEPFEKQNVRIEKKGDVVRIFDEKTRKTVGYNIFQASRHFSLKAERGRAAVDREMIDAVNRLLRENGFEEISADLSPKFVVGLVKEKKKHPNADKLSVCQVDVGGEVLQIVCGAPNVEAGQKVVVAKVGAVMPSGMVIKEAELRGVKSMGMICSARELELPDAPQEKGILVLDDAYRVGEPFEFPGQ
jgi:tRNA-binding protein